MRTRLGRAPCPRRPACHCKGNSPKSCDWPLPSLEPLAAYQLAAPSAARTRIVTMLYVLRPRGIRLVEINNTDSRQIAQDILPCRDGPPPCDPMTAVHHPNRCNLQINFRRPCPPNVKRSLHFETRLYHAKTCRLRQRGTVRSVAGPSKTVDGATSKAGCRSPVGDAGRRRYPDHANLDNRCAGAHRMLPERTRDRAWRISRRHEPSLSPVSIMLSNWASARSCGTCRRKSRHYSWTGVVRTRSPRDGD